MRIVVKAAHAGDTEIMALLGRITFAETFGTLFRDHQDELHGYLDATFGVAKIRRSLGRPEHGWWLAWADDLPVGYAKLTQPSPVMQLADPDAAQLQKIYVLREFTGAGIGALLLAAALDRAASVSAVWLTVLRENERAIRFYDHLGFAPIGDHAFAIGSQTFAFRLMARRRV